MSANRYSKHSHLPSPLSARRIASPARSRLGGFFSETTPSAIARLLGWHERGGAAPLGPCLCFPVYLADGRPSGYVRCKPDRPRRAQDKKLVKYESPLERPNRVYLPP